MAAAFFAISAITSFMAPALKRYAQYVPPFFLPFSLFNARPEEQHTSLELYLIIFSFNLINIDAQNQMKFRCIWNN